MNIGITELLAAIPFLLFLAAIGYGIYWFVRPDRDKRAQARTVRAAMRERKRELRGD